jgi:hypothetical protein
VWLLQLFLVIQRHGPIRPGGSRQRFAGWTDGLLVRRCGIDTRCVVVKIADGYNNGQSYGRVHMTNP